MGFFLWFDLGDSYDLRIWDYEGGIWVYEGGIRDSEGDIRIELWIDYRRSLT